MNKLVLSKQVTVYHNIEKALIGRIPTKSNLKNSGSDNSLYFGTIANENMIMILCDVFHLRDLSAFGNRQYIFKAYGKNVSVKTNINNDGQIQFKFDSDGTMGNMFYDYLFFSMHKVDPDEVILVLDFNNKIVYFERVRDINGK